jgi:beta-lactamase superfamily II metal-dependent hydrolase
MTNTVRVHAQQVHPIKGTTPPRRSVLLDVADDVEHDRIAGSAGSSQSRSARGQASMLRLEYVPDGRKGFREGSWYEVDLNLWADMKYEPVLRTAPGASYLGGTLVAPPVPINASRFLTARQYMDGTIGDVNMGQSSRLSHSTPLVRIKRPKLTVVHCGQGNWNEVETHDVRLIYDTGACRNYGSKQLRSLIDSRKFLQERRPIYLFLSHWDIDHYHALLKFKAAELAKIQHVYAPDRLPNTATLKRVRALLAANGVPLTLLPTQPHPNGKGPIQLVAISHAGPFTIFRSTAGSSTNQTGIVVQVEGTKRFALLTGDHYYSKVLAASNALPGKTCELVVPHHGGECGVLDQTAWLAKHAGIKTIISVGTNPWNHPRPKYLGGLAALQGGAKPWRTDKHGTYVKLL